MSNAVAYLRRSHADAGSPGDVSRAVQEAAVRELAQSEGHNGDVRYYVDWARSADEEKAAKRTEYAAMLRAVEAGEVDTIYAYALDRRARSVGMTGKLLGAARDRGVRIVTHREGDLSDDGNPSKWLHTMMVSTFSEYELRTIKKRAEATIIRRRQRGDVFGRPPFGYARERDADGRVVWVRDPSQPIEPVLEAFREAGTFGSAAKLLNQRGFPAPRGGSWAGNVVNRIVRREAPELAPIRRGEKRVAPRGSHVFSRLLRCPCGQLMTPRTTSHTTKYGSYGPYVSYQCHRGRYDPRHPRPYMVGESAILSWAKAEAARLVTPDAVQLAEDDAGQRAELAEDRRRAGVAYAARALSDDEFNAAIAHIDDALNRLEDRAAAPAIPPVDWSWDRPELNAVLRAMWSHIELDADLRPVRAIWRVPEWRA